MGKEPPHEQNLTGSHNSPGTRLELIGMDDPFAPIPAGMRGTVHYVDTSLRFM